MTVWIHLAAVGFAALSLLGCAEIGERPAVHQDQILRFETAEVPKVGAHADVKQEGTTIQLAVAHICDVKRENLVNRTSTTRFFNRSSTQSWLVAGAGLLSAGTGTALVIDSAHTFPNDRASRMYNSTGPGNEKLYGFGLIGTGALLGTVALVDAIRASGSNVERSQTTEEGGIVRRAIVCTNTAGRKRRNYWQPW